MSAENHTSSKKSTHVLRELYGKARLQYLWDYYKLPFALICIVVYIVGYSLYGHFTKKDDLLYIGFANLIFGDTLSQQLTTDYISYCSLDERKNEIYTYQDLYLSSNPSDANTQYAYISNTKILAAIDSQKLDLVFMNQEALEIFTCNEYLSDLTSLVSTEIMNEQDSVYAIDISGTACIQDAEFKDTIYIGLINNSPRKWEAVEYIDYLLIAKTAN